MSVDEQCVELQADELTVLESIYPSQIVVHPNPTSKPGQLLTLTIPISLPSPTFLSLPSSASTSLHVTHLPPLNVRLVLPPVYPLEAPPRAVSLRASLPGQDAAWLARGVLERVTDRLARMWDEDRAGGEGVGVLWRWWMWVGGGEFLIDLGLQKGDTIELQPPPSVPASTLHTALKSFNAAQLRDSFASTAFDCAICFETRKGKACVELACACVFCTPCLSACWTLAISEGSIENVACPSVECTKARAQVDRQATDGDVAPELVESVVGPELRTRWETLKETRRAEIDPRWTTCPRPTCQAPVPPPAKPTADQLAAHAAIASRAIRLSDISKPASAAVSAPPTPPPTAAPAADAAEDRWDRFRLCPRCSFSFCLYCSATWHGAHTPCAFPQMSAIVQEYLGHPEGSEGRARIEVQRGRANIERMVARWREDEENRKWLESRTRGCAGCGVRVEKSHGCNHMTCGRCMAHFCYRCGDSISPADPYTHYRRPGHPCFERLFDQDEIDRFAREIQTGADGGGGGDVEAGEAGMEWNELRGVWEWWQ
ncbi:hypothetical protein Q5752_000386 [Cryptotrichosporon argae]